MPEVMQETLVSNYSWLLAPGDDTQADYTSPTKVKNWLHATAITMVQTDKQKAYGQWIAQLLQNQLGVELAPLYHKDGQTEWPFTLRDDVIQALDEYFVTCAEQSERSKSA